MELETLTLEEVESFSPEELSHVISNGHKVTPQLVELSKNLIPLKIEKRRSEIRIKTDEINKITTGTGHFEIDIHELANGKLTIGASQCCAHCGHTFEMIFESVYHFSGNIWSFTIDTDKPFIRLASDEEQINFNIKFELIQFNQTFILEVEDGKPVFISCKDISYETEKSKMLN